MAALPSLPPRVEAMRHWLFAEAIPLWLVHGVDHARGGFYDALDRDTAANCAPIKRLRVTARQIYVFTEAALRGVPGARAAVEHGLTFLLTKLRHPQGGFVRSCDLHGMIIDDSRDLYDLAFTLFALAHASRLINDNRLRDEALGLLEFLQKHMRHPAGGYREALPDRVPRRQNPHMHLLEAALACWEHIPDARFRALSIEMAELAEQHFIDAGKGLLFEYYSPDWVPDRLHGRAVVEPGHHFEWIWLLAELDRLFGVRLEGAAALARFAREHGFNTADGLLRGVLYEDGAVCEASVRLWPHSEWLRATLVFEAAGSVDTALAAMTRFLDTPRTGLWFEHWNADRRVFESKAVPASSLYHIMSALVALDRAMA